MGIIKWLLTRIQEVALEASLKEQLKFFKNTQAKEGEVIFNWI
jgi:hypothetical protein